MVCECVLWPRHTRQLLPTSWSNLIYPSVLCLCHLQSLFTTSASLKPSHLQDPREQSRGFWLESLSENRNHLDLTGLEQEKCVQESQEQIRSLSGVASLRWAFLGEWGGSRVTILPTRKAFPCENRLWSLKTQKRTNNITASFSFTHSGNTSLN